MSLFHKEGIENICYSKVDQNISLNMETTDNETCV